jgi:hypothetical protein
MGAGKQLTMVRRWVGLGDDYYYSCTLLVVSTCVHLTACVLGLVRLYETKDIHGRYQVAAPESR